MSNHWHGVVTDPEARLPEFLERFHRLVARALNAILGRWENLWSSDKPSVVRLVSDEDVLEKMAYVIANPTAAGLVSAPSEWPGVLEHRFGTRTSIKRPETFFRREGKLPETTPLEISRPDIFRGLSDADLASCLARAVDRLVDRAGQILRKAGRAFLGARAVLRQDPRSSPATREEKRTPNPRIAAARPAERLDALQRMAAFIRTYRTAWQAWRSGGQDVVFPAGTYALRRLACVTCLAPTGYAA
jgi:hypothetical protein